MDPKLLVVNYSRIKEEVENFINGAEDIESLKGIVNDGTMWEQIEFEIEIEDGNDYIHQTTNLLSEIFDTVQDRSFIILRAQALEKEYLDKISKLGALVNKVNENNVFATPVVETGMTTCPECGTVFESKFNKKYCSYKCSKRASNRRHRERSNLSK